MPNEEELAFRIVENNMRRLTLNDYPWLILTSRIQISVNLFDLHVQMLTLVTSLVSSLRKKQST